MIECPKCNIALTDIQETGYSEAICSRCKYKYGAVTGRVVKRSTRQITLQRQTTKQSGRYKRYYEFRLDLPDGSMRPIEFTVDGKEDWVLVRRGDNITILFTMRGDAIEEHVSVSDHTTSQRYVLARPGDTARGTAIGIGSFVFVALAVLLIWLSSLPIAASLGIAALSGFGAYFLFVPLLVPRVRLAATENAEIQQTQKLLAKKLEFITRRQEVSGTLAQRNALRKKLASLQKKMRSVDSALYDSRIGIVDRAIALVDQLNEVDARLVSEYDKTITMLEIELDARDTTESLPDNVLSHLQERFDSIASAEEHNRELRLQLEANEEVAKLAKA